MEGILQLKEVSYDYHTKAGVVHALKNATASFDEGKLYAIVGRSGSGKSTMMSLCAGLDMPKSGDILFRSKSLREQDCYQYRRKYACMIFQSFYLLPQLTAAENVELSLELIKYKGNKKKRAVELLEMVGLTPFHGKKRSFQLSGGEQQRVAIARAIAPDPCIVLADEPTGSLDNENSMNIITLLKRMAHEDKKCVIVITHAGEIAAEADIIYYMDDGTLMTKKSG